MNNATENFTNLSGDGGRKS